MGSLGTAWRWGTPDMSPVISHKRLVTLIEPQLLCRIMLKTQQEIIHESESQSEKTRILKMCYVMNNSVISINDLWLSVLCSSAGQKTLTIDFKIGFTSWFGLEQTSWLAGIVLSALLLLLISFWNRQTCQNRTACVTVNSRISFFNMASFYFVTRQMLRVLFFFNRSWPGFVISHLRLVSSLCSPFLPSPSRQPGPVAGPSIFALQFFFRDSLPWRTPEARQKPVTSQTNLLDICSSGVDSAFFLFVSFFFNCILTFPPRTIRSSL